MDPTDSIDLTREYTCGRRMTMPFTIEDIQDLIRLLGERPEWRAELRRWVLTDELLERGLREDVLSDEDHREVLLADLIIRGAGGRTTRRSISSSRCRPGSGPPTWSARRSERRSRPSWASPRFRWSRGRGSRRMRKSLPVPAASGGSPTAEPFLRTRSGPYSQPWPVRAASPDDNRRISSIH